MQSTTIAITLSVLSFMMSVIWGQPLLRVLKHFRIGKLIRVEEPQSNQLKMGVPTMGGVIFILPALLLTILFNIVDFISFSQEGLPLLLLVAVVIAYAVLGGIDDWEGIRGTRRGLGMRVRTKFVLQILLALIIALLLYYIVQPPWMFWPPTHAIINIGPIYIPLATFIIVGMSNAVNFTDGLDGLAGLISAMGFVAYGAIALSQGQGLVAQFCFIMVGALFGFLWFNVHPAAMIMGDVGSLALGSSLGVVALLTGQWLLLPIIAIVPVAEAASVSIQILYFKATHGKRFFRLAPFHYHFLLQGWSETQVVQRFWLVSLIFALLGVAIASM